MARPKRFSALRKWLASTAAGGAGADDQDQGGGEGEGEDAGEGEGEDDGEGGDQDQGGGEGEDAGEDAGEGDGGDGEGAGEGDGGGSEGADANHAQYAHGVAAERRRWATVLSSDPAEHRVEAAVGLLVEDMTAERIIGMLPRMPKDANTAALALLAKAPKHNLRGTAGDEGGEDTAAASRKRVVARHNKSVQGGVKSRARPRTRKAAEREEE